MQLFYGVPEDIENWMSLVTQVRWNFPGLETQEKLNEHRATVLKFMDKRQAICIKDENEIAGVMLFLRGHNMICYLAVSPEYRRRGVASILMDEVLTNLDRTKEISVSTFRADDEKGTAPRALYEKYGFVADELIEEFDYPNQKYVLHPAGSERKERQLAINTTVREISAERGKTVYATAARAGAILVDNGNLKLLGDVKVFGR
ncbi:GNAT family N-acetyltransferase [Firmicutes bacterium AF25-13AC]|nr:GNAT family N-acetyltransferase [Firmicutes bacterium AF25-13AC]